MAQNFDRAACIYDKFSSIQSSCAEFLCHLLFKHLPDLYPAKILDIGSGTGALVKLMLKKFPKSYVVANDISALMLQEIEKRFSGSKRLEVLLGDMDEVYLPSCGLVVSNFAMQWSSNICTLIKKVLSQSDVFAFSTLLDGTFYQLTSLLGIKGFLSYPTKEEICIYMRKLNVHQIIFEAKEFYLLFENFYAFLQYVRNLGIGNNNEIGYSENLLRAAKDMKKEFLVSYNVLFAIVKKGHF
ncbi:Malonyl-acyl carrier protein O-methyltransferase BioC [Candidatus Cyrtobacter comes]|uniref:Malonyl-acyl carrier protein O-methyltransferase BioC n=1 Tax=Candidatus Cyrtobacter comes TaxID=675776 RepID=A0ABU5L944_9RICK|nr:Malonyl-acyl carrier protein O-methyltransferase BioC [Candidatus Cyrtobacter comes]